MSDPQVLSTLRRKRDDIERAIGAYEKKLTQARTDLSHVSASIRLFELEGDRSEFPAYMDVHRLFRRGEVAIICKAALAAEGPLDTRQLCLRVMRAKGLDEADAPLRTSLTYRIVQVMRMQWKRGLVESPEKRADVRVWSVLAQIV